MYVIVFTGSQTTEMRLTLTPSSNIL